MKAGFADPAAFGLPVRGLICQSPKDRFATRLVSLPRLSSLMRASAGTCTAQFCNFALQKTHCGSSLVSLGKYCKNSVTSRDYEHLNNAIGLFAPMAACCTPSVDMAISQTYQPKVTNTMPYNFSTPFCWIENSWIHPERSLSELAFGRSGFVLSVCWGDVPGVWRQPTGLFQAHKGDYAKNAKSVEKDSLKITFFVTSLLNPYF